MPTIKVTEGLTRENLHLTNSVNLTKIKVT